MFTCGGFSLQIIKAKVLEVGDKLLIYIQQRAARGDAVGVGAWGRGRGHETAVQSA